METEKIRVLQLENTHNAHGGRCMPIELHKRLYQLRNKGPVSADQRTEGRPDPLGNTEHHRIRVPMRQAGVMAAPALYALKNLTARMREDHIRARKMAELSVPTIRGFPR